MQPEFVVEMMIREERQRSKAHDTRTEEESERASVSPWIQIHFDIRRNAEFKGKQESSYNSFGVIERNEQENADV